MATYILFHKDLDGVASANIVLRYIFRANKDIFIKPAQSYKILPFIRKSIPRNSTLVLLDLSLTLPPREIENIKRVVKNRHLKIKLLDHHVSNSLKHIADDYIIEPVPSVAVLVKLLVEKEYGIKLTGADNILVELASASDQSACDKLDDKKLCRACDIWDYIIPYLSDKYVRKLAYNIHETILHPPMNVYRSIRGEAIKCLRLVEKDTILDGEYLVSYVVTEKKLMYPEIYRRYRQSKRLVAVFQNNGGPYTVVKIFGKDYDLVAKLYRALLKNVGAVARGGRKVKVLKLARRLSKEEVEKIVRESVLS